MTENTDIIETNIPAQEWEEDIKFYSQLLGSPKDAAASPVVFQLPNSTFELRLTKVNTVEENRTGRKPKHVHIVKGPNGEQGVKDAYKALRGRTPAPPCDIEPHTVNGPSGKKLYLAYAVLEKSASLAAERVEGIVHNPDWN